MAKILDGNILAEKLINDLKEQVKSIKTNIGFVPKVVNISIGNEYGTCAYAKAQEKVSSKIEIDYELICLAPSITQEELENKICKLNSDKTVNGIMIHKPVPKTIDYAKASELISTLKDLEGINVENIGKMIKRQTNIIPCTPAAVMEHLKSIDVKLRGKEAVIIGHSDIVGKPLSLLLLNELATVTVCHIATSEAGKLKEHIARAEVLVVAVGKAEIIKGEWIKEGTVVIDVGINRVDGKLIGDVEFKSASEKAAFITPVPGGVGPVTVVMLMKNAIEAFKLQNNIKG